MGRVWWPLSSLSPRRGWTGSRCGRIGRGGAGLDRDSAGLNQLSVAAFAHVQSGQASVSVCTSNRPHVAQANHDSASSRWF